MTTKRVFLAGLIAGAVAAVPALPVAGAALDNKEIKLSGCLIRGDGDGSGQFPSHHFPSRPEFGDRGEFASVTSGCAADSLFVPIPLVIHAELWSLLMNRSLHIAVALVVCTLISTAAYAQATRTWISGVGDDVNPCSRTAPCKTFSGAISKTAAGGEISVLDPGGFGGVTITRSITLDGDGTLASILVSGTNGITINSPGIVVTLRNLSIFGPAGAGLKGISLLNGTALIVDRVAISGFETGISTAAGDTTVVGSTITQNSGYGVRAIGGSITLENSILSNNGVAAQADTGAIIRLSNNGIYNNLTGFGCGGGALASAGNNRKANNTGGIVPVCAPTLAITLQ